MEIHLTQEMIENINLVSNEVIERVAVPGQYRIWRSDIENDIISIGVAPYDPI